VSNIPTYKILRAKDQSFGGWGDLIGLTSGEVFHDRTIEASNPTEAKEKASKLFGIPEDTIEVEEVKKDKR